MEAAVDVVHVAGDGTRGVADEERAQRADVVDLLHVGSCIPRKRIDVLLKVLRAVREVDPRVRLLKAGNLREMETAGA